MASALAEKLARVAGRSTVRLTHQGRKSGKPYAVTIWFIVDGDKVYLPTADVNRNWVRNVKKTPRVKLSIGAETFEGEARFLADSAGRDHVIALVRRKYWLAIPMIAFGELLATLGLRQDTSGAFEVNLTA